MKELETVVIFVHGANQADKTEAENRQLWEEVFELMPRAQLNKLFAGGLNTEIQQYHAKQKGERIIPQYVGWSPAWYGGIYKGLSEQVTGGDDIFGDRLNASTDAEKKDCEVLLEKVERGIMQKSFDELVPFYELAIVKGQNKTLYELLCDKFLGNIISATNNGQYSYVLVGHSMGCAMTYNVMSHISSAKAGVDYCRSIKGTLSEDYRAKVSAFAGKSSRCFGLITLGNYTGYNWCQRLNSNIISGERKTQFVYPGAIARWFNFWTVFGGDTVVIDDKLADSLVKDANSDQYQDVMVLRLPFVNRGHERPAWFRRPDFVRQFANKLKHNLYWTP